MKSAILSLSILFTAAAQPPGYAPPAPYPQTAMSCGNGVVVRADGSVMVDEWTQYMSTPGASITRNYPTSVTIGKSLKDLVNICLEFENGTLCADIGKLRAILEGLKPSATEKKVK